ncbi:MAG: CvpA family protein [Marinicellaceae bacterium]
MNWLDFVFIGIISLSVIISLFRGLIKEVFSLLIWIGAFWAAYHFVDLGADAISGFIELASARHLIAFVGIFITALILGGMINFIISKLVSKTGLSGTDRFFGMFFGALRGLVVIIAITFFIKATPLSEDMWWKDSKLSPHFTKISEWVRTKMPDSFSKYFSFIENNKENNKENEMQKLIDSLVKEDMSNQTPESSDETIVTKPEEDQ